MNERTTKSWYEKSYGNKGLKAQRLYPNEELLRFMGRNFFGLNRRDRSRVKILEVGSGTCSNLWMIAKEGFDAYGIDLSEKSAALGERMLAHWETRAHLEVGSMTKLPYGTALMDVVVDVFSSNCLIRSDFQKFISEAARVLKRNGKLFIYTPSVDSHALKRYAPAKRIDKFTLNGIYRKSSPFYGNFYPFRFSKVSSLKRLLRKTGFRVDYCETISRTYRDRQEMFQHISLEATRL